LRVSWWGEDLLYGAAEDEVWAFGATPVTYGRMRAEVEWHRRVLHRQGVGAGTSAALLGQSSFTQLWTLFALWSLGAQPLLLPPRLAPGERVRLLETLRPQYALTFGVPSTRRVFRDECEVLARRLPGGLPARTPHCVVQLSSGTTGGGKAVGRTPESLLAELERFALLDGMPRRDEPVLLLDSWAYSFGLVGGVLHATRHGAPLVLPGVAEHGARPVPRVVIGAPRHFEAFSAAPEAAFRGLRRAISGGELLHLAVFDSFARRFGVRIGQVYGMTETGAIAADLSGRLAPPHVGAPLPGIRTRVVDGVLEVHLGQSPYVPEHEVWRGGWLSTNDMVSRDAVTGALRLRGRLSGTEGPPDTRVDLVAIERVLRAHHDVAEAVVVGSGTIDALVVGRGPGGLRGPGGSGGLDGLALEAWCRQVLGPGHPPVRCCVVGALPRTANGKYIRSRRVVSEAGARS
jgi:acyl-coenzyme A synthetase/AMP-(fatty) acid ligase